MPTSHHPLTVNFSRTRGTSMKTTGAASAMLCVEFSAIYRRDATGVKTERSRFFCQLAARYRYIHASATYNRIEILAIPAFYT